jgi:hypothetical protein
MKKNLIAILIIALVSVGLFADPITSTFDVTTSVKSINELKLTEGALSSPYPTSLVGFDEFSDDVVIDSDGETEDFTAYISVLSNHKAGFTVTMSASPMISTTAPTTNTYEIDYTVTVGTGQSAKSYTTNATASAVTVFEETAIMALTGESKILSVEVDPDTFTAAIEDDYKGTVTFTYTAK